MKTDLLLEVRREVEALRKQRYSSTRYKALSEVLNVIDRIREREAAAQV
jgi:hypothetical protein